MNKKVLKLTALLLILVGSLSSCDKLRNFEFDKINFQSLHKEAIVGKWKLVEIKQWYHRDGKWNLVSYDHSQHDIVYEFTKSGILKVAGDIDSVNIYIRHEQGTYPYSFIEDKKSEMNGLSYGLEIGIYGATYWYRFFSGKLEITLAPVDGPAYYFVRIIN